ncbi:ISL3 family transposase [Vagococcus martis]|uniref:ISL3 family transposase n=1 Tax=Vagococcus martis TaxID=1768210 RepID=A0A1V4DE92_9ENTE|nr:ISL3 family transposase [Vagococcus martis]OPF86859.1 ISL3 family transposase [Vagococcus martis]
MDNNTRKLLNLTDDSLIFNEDWLSREARNNRSVNMITGRLVNKDKQCQKCGCYQSVKNGTYQTISQLPEVERRPTYLKLHRERYLCRNCGSTFSASTSLVDDYCQISKQLKYQIAFDLKENQSRKKIAECHSVSENTVKRVLVSFTNNQQPNFNFLPTALCVDEFSSTSDCHAGMSFICADAASKKIIDILPDKRLHKLVSYFMKYSRESRLKVRFLVMDMNASYGQLLKTVFPNAEIVTDRFHIIQHINRSFNILRIKEMNQLKRHNQAEGKQYRRLKRYWKLLLKDSSELNYKHFYYRPLFKRNMSSTELVDELLSYSSLLKKAYHFMQELKYAYRTNDYVLFLELCSKIPVELPKYFRDKFKIFGKFSQGVMNAFKYSYSNGFLEGINNKIKVIKRVAYGYRNFLLFKRRIFLIQNQVFQVK